MKTALQILTIAFALLFVYITSMQGQTKAIGKGTVMRIKLHGKSLEGNLEGDSADRNVSIYLPAGYKSDPGKRYPVVYFLHGFTDDDAKFYGSKSHWMKLPPVLDTAFAQGKANEMIFVTPDACTRYQGSWYSNSITTGNWEDFISYELVAYIDGHYRTIPKASGRGLAGHSMGGYGALRIGQKHPEIFSSIYLLSPGALMPNTGFSPDSKAETIKTFADFEKADFGTKVLLAMAAAWSPDLNNPPLYLQLPVKDGLLLPDVQNKWIANSPVAVLDQYIINLKKLSGIGFDAGDKDEKIAASTRVLDLELTRFKVAHQFEIYNGNHTNQVAKRIGDTMLKFFSQNLSSNTQ